MKTSVVEKEYLNLNKAIFELQTKWKESLPSGAVEPKLEKAALEAGIPVAALTSFHFDIPLFLRWIEETIALVIDANGEQAGKLKKLGSLLNEEALLRWTEEALVCNQQYFHEFAEQHNLEGWIPQFFAETAVRPYLQLLAETVQEQIEYAVAGAGCPVCGEPARLAALEAEGKKVVHCPRCTLHWKSKRLECSHCGNEDHTKTKFLTIEEDPASQIQVCEECNGYMKVIDTRQYMTKPSPALLDLNTLHLDFVAQENGYQAVGTKNTAN